MIPDGVWPDLNEGTYHADPALGSSSIKALAESPATYAWLRDHPVIATPAMIRGTAVHSMILGGPDIEIADPDVETVAELHARGAVAVDPDDVPRIVGMVRALEADEDARMLLHPQAGDTELSLFATANSVRVKARFDAWHSSGLGLGVDLKTTTGSVTPRAIRRKAHDWGWHIQAGHYVEVAVLAGLEVPAEFVFVVVSSDPPHLVQPVALSPDLLALGREIARDAVATYAVAELRGDWSPRRTPGIPVIHPYRPEEVDYL